MFHRAGIREALQHALGVVNEWLVLSHMHRLATSQEFTLYARRSLSNTYLKPPARIVVP